VTWYFQHRIDPDDPIEKLVAAMAEPVKDAKVRFLSECSGEILRHEYKVHPIAVCPNGILPLVTG
jgi:aryl-alcohol dehydrogenase-like predicted oxidoreductase